MPIMRLVRGPLWLRRPAIAAHVDRGTDLARDLGEDIAAAGVPIAERTWAAPGNQRGFPDRPGIKPEPIGHEPPRLAGGRYSEPGGSAGEAAP